MTRAGIALGSNIGARSRHLASAREMIAALPRVQAPVLASPLYETAPIGCEPGAANFLNGVVEIGYDGDAHALLHELRKIESILGRSVDHQRNASRTIDLDLLYFGTSAITTGTLQVPHPRMHERRFVLQPLADIRPALLLPSQTETVAELLQQLTDPSAVVRSTAQW